jgi:hypothetical protein
MSVLATCPKCGEQFRRPDGLAGKTEKCPACRFVFRLPARSAPTPVAKAKPEAKPQEQPQTVVTTEPEEPREPPPVTRTEPQKPQEQPLPVAKVQWPDEWGRLTAKESQTQPLPVARTEPEKSHAQPLPAANAEPVRLQEQPQSDRGVAGPVVCADIGVSEGLGVLPDSSATVLDAKPGGKNGRAATASPAVVARAAKPGFLGRLFGRGRSTGVEESRCTVAFDASGLVTSVKVPQARWAVEKKGQNKYCTAKADSLLEAAEVLKALRSIPPSTFYVVDTSDGSLARDTYGYYTEAPIKTEGLFVEWRQDRSEAVGALSFKGFGDMQSNQTTVADLRRRGEYSRLVLLMKCGCCGYESPVETEPGPLTRECYCCGARNEGRRAPVQVVLDSTAVEI